MGNRERSIRDAAPAFDSAAGMAGAAESPTALHSRGRRDTAPETPTRRAGSLMRVLRILGKPGQRQIAENRVEPSLIIAAFENSPMHE